jgi:hypothetical protein
MILVLLLAVGVALIVEGSLPGDTPVLLPSTSVFWVGADLLFGLGIGLVSSLLGVAGGEVIIPTLVFAYGADIKTAGTTSLLISLPTSPSALPATPGNMPTHREPSPRPSPRCSWAW